MSPSEAPDCWDCSSSSTESASKRLCFDGNTGDRENGSTSGVKMGHVVSTSSSTGVNEPLVLECKCLLVSRSVNQWYGCK